MTIYTLSNLCHERLTPFYDTACQEAAKLYHETGRQLARLTNDVQKVAHGTFIVLAIAFGARLNPTLFWASLLVGILWDKGVSNKVHEVNADIVKHPYRTCAVGALLVVLNPQATLLTTSVWLGLTYLENEKNVERTLLAAMGTFFNLPAALVAYSIFAGCHLGAFIRSAGETVETAPSNVRG